MGVSRVGLFRSGFVIDGQGCARGKTILHVISAGRPTLGTGGIRPSLRSLCLCCFHRRKRG